MRIDKFASFLDQFKDIVKKFESKEAISDELTNVFLTYKQLDDFSNSILIKLKEYGSKEKEKILVILDRNKYIASCAIAIFKNKCVYVPINESYPLEKIKLIVEETKSKTIITNSKLYNSMNLKTLKMNYVFIDKISSKAKLNHNEEIKLKEDDDAFILFTSGTTGKPKGVVHTHKSLMALLQFNEIKEMEFTQTSICAVTNNFSFIGSIPFIFSPLIKGGKTIIASNDSLFNIGKLYKFIIDHNITECVLPPGIREKLLEKYNLEGRKFWIGSDKINNFKLKSKCSVFNIYGSTEGLFVSIAKINGNEKIIPIGKPPKNVEYKLVNDGLKEIVGQGIGELIYHADFMAKEYHNLKEENAERFIIIKNKKYFRTHDLIRRDKQGVLYYHGRIDNMVKIRGYRVELEEVERKISSLQIEGIEDLVCQCKEIEGKNNLVCFYIARHEIDINKTRDKLNKILQDYMIPTIFVRVKSFPKNNNGKILRNKLEIPNNNKIKSVLNSFELVRLNSKLYEEKNVSIPFDKLITIKNINEFNEIATQIISKTNKIDNIHFNIEYGPLSTAQSQMISTIDFLKGKDILHNPFLYKLPKNSDLEKIRVALIKTINVNNYINTFIFQKNNSIYQTKGNKLKNDYLFPTIKIKESELKNIENKLIYPFQYFSDHLYRIVFIKTEKNMYLFLDFCHLIFDGSSYDIFINDFRRFYRGEVVSEKENNYLDYAMQLFDYTEENSEYWKKRLSMHEVSGAFIYDLKKSGEEKASFHTLKTKFNLNIVNKLTKKYQCKENILFLTILLLTIYFFNDENKMSLIINASRLKEARFANCVGLFNRTTPFIYEIVEKKIKDLIDNVDKLFYEDIKRDDFSVDNSYKTFGFSTSILYAYQNKMSQFEETLVPNSKKIKLKYDDTYMFDTVFKIASSHNETYLELHYNPKLYSKFYIESIVRTYHKILNEFLIKDFINDIEPTDRKLIKYLDRFNHPKMPIIKKSVVDLFKQCVKNCPNNICVVGNSSYTYKEIDTLTDKIAKNIIKTTKGRETFIPVYTYRNEYMVICALSIIKAGAAYQPIDTKYPQDHIKNMLKDSKPLVMFADDKFDNTIIDKKVKIISLNEINKLKQVETKLPKISSNNAFAILYTSGSTGKPKGIILEHKNLVSYINWHKRYYNDNSGDRVGCYSSYGFDVCMGSIFSTITTGGTLYIINENIRLDLDEVNNFITKNKINKIDMTTQIGFQFAKMFKNKYLKHLTVGGEKLPNIDPPIGYTLNNGYAPTECTIYATMNPVTKGMVDIPIGKANDEVNLYIVNKFGKRLPPYALGELIISGNQVARSYNNIISDRFTTYNNQKAYKTGDIVRMIYNGAVEYFHRNDHQIKIRGYRIEISEIENAISKYKGVKKAIVQVVKNNNDLFLAAYIIKKAKVDFDKLKSYLLSIMPEYKVPTYYIEIDKIPYNQNQKIDRKKLPAPSFTDNKVKYVAPRNKQEEIIIECVKEVLKIKDNIGIDSSFVSLGGNSINAIRLAYKLNSLNIKISVNQILKCNSIRQISETINIKPHIEDVHYYSKNNKKKLVFIHSANTGSESFFKLSDYLKNRCEFLVIEHYNINHFESQIKSIPELAKKYIEILKKEQPHGPYNLGGLSYGGIVAYEMARQLISQKEEIASLILIDPTCINKKSKLYKSFIKKDLEQSEQYLTTAPIFKTMRDNGHLEKLIKLYKSTINMIANYRIENINCNTLYITIPHKKNDLMITFDKYLNPNKSKILRINIPHDELILEKAIKQYINEIYNIAKI